ncbi:ADP-ribosylglycohydrolase family protein, partial [Streptomyces sp. ZG43]
MNRPATGALLGLALGDALGFPTEFNDVPAILAKCGPWREMALPRPAYITDDTQMTLSVARALRDTLHGGPLDATRLEGPLRAEFTAWYRSPDNNRAPGRTCLTACAALERPGLAWADASQTGSKGCGANMRVAPVGLV